MVLGPQGNKITNVSINRAKNEIIIKNVTEKDFVPEYLKYFKEYLCMRFNMDISKTKILFK